MRRPSGPAGWLAVIGLSCVLAAGGAAAASSREASTGVYRTATAATGSVQEHVDLTGTVSSSGRTDLAFSTAGTVARSSNGAAQPNTAATIAMPPPRGVGTLCERRCPG